MSSFSFEEYLILINRYLDASIAPFDDARDNIASAMKYSLVAGGKRIRPVLTLEFARLCNGNVYDALPFAAAVEMVHTYSLIHDDLPCMDDDDYRRGRQSCHVKFGESTALLAGDALLTLAFSELCNSNSGSDAIVRAVACLSRRAGYAGMIGGQAIDLDNELKQVDKDGLRHMDELKTGEMISCACELGCISAGAGGEKLSAAKKYAYSIGLAFQIKDDLLDIESTDVELGKPIGSDTENGKSTYPSLIGIDKCRQLIAELTCEAKEALAVFGDESAFLTQLAESLATRKN